VLSTQAFTVNAIGMRSTWVIAFIAKKKLRIQQHNRYQTRKVGLKGCNREDKTFCAKFAISAENNRTCRDVMIPVLVRLAPLGEYDKKSSAASPADEKRLDPTCPNPV